MAALMKAVDALSRHFELPPADAAPVAKRETRWRGLRIGNVGLLVAHDCGGELIEDARICPLPRAPRWCRGLLNLRGQLIPVFDLHERLRLTHHRAAKQWWLVLGRGSDAVAFAIDALPKSIVVDDAAKIQTIAVPAELRSFAGQAYRAAGELWLEFKHREFFRAASIAAA